MPVYEIQTDKGTYEIDADREPTQAEALQAISGQASPSITPPPTTRPQSDFETFRQNYIAQQEAPTLSKAISASIAPVEGLYNMASDIASIPAGLGEATGTQTPVGTTLNSLLEGARRTGAGFVNMGRNYLDQALRGLITNPLNPTAGLIQNQIRDVQSRTPGELEIEKAYQEQNLQNALNLPENQLQPLQGGISENLSQGTASALPLAIPLVGAEERLATANLLKRPVTSVANTLERVTARGFTKPLEDAVTNVTGIAPIDGGVETAQIAKARIEEKTGKFPTREQGAAETVVKQAEKTGDALIDETKDYLKSATEKGLTVDETSILEQAKNEIRNRFKLKAGDEDAVSAIFDKPEFKNLQEKAIPTDVQSHVQEFNTQYQTFEPRFNKTPEAMAYKIVRDFLSDANDSLVKIESGKDISPYRDWGHVQDFKNGVEGRIRSAQLSQGGIEPNEVSGTVPLSKTGAVAKGVKAVGGRVAVARQIEAINQDMLKVGKGLKGKPLGGNLSKESLASLRASLNPPPIIKSSPARGAIPPPNTANLIEAKIQQRIRSLSPTLVNSLSEADLRQLVVDQLTSEGLL